MTAAITAKRDKLAADVKWYLTELENSYVELKRTRNEIEGVKKRLKEVWRMTCDESISFDEELAAKETETAELNRKLLAASGAHSGVTILSRSLPHRTP